MARRSGLSRGTLLYYDRIGLLSPSSRSPAGYRRYGQADATRLAWICRYRRAGLPLAMIKDLLDADAEPGAEPGDPAGTLVARLAALNDELRRVRGQQRFILDLLGHDPRYESLPFLSRATFLELFRQAGISEEQQERWHAAFENLARDEHQAFLEFLCFGDEAIERIRRRSAR